MSKKKNLKRKEDIFFVKITTFHRLPSVGWVSSLTVSMVSIVLRFVPSFSKMYTLCGNTYPLSPPLRNMQLKYILEYL